MRWEVGLKRCLLAAVVKVSNSLTIDKFFDSFSHLHEFYKTNLNTEFLFIFDLGIFLRGLKSNLVVVEVGATLKKYCKD